MSKFGGLTIQINNLTAEKRKLEGQIAVLEGDLDDATGAKDVSYYCIFKTSITRLFTL